MGTDPFTKTWWFLEARDGSWLADDKHELFTRDPNQAMKWPNKTHAGRALARLHNALWVKIEGPTEHRFVKEDDAEPVAWRVKDFADGWILHHTRAAAEDEARDTGALIQPLYTRAA